MSAAKDKSSNDSSGQSGGGSKLGENPNRVVHGSGTGPPSKDEREYRGTLDYLFGCDRRGESG